MVSAKREWAERVREYAARGPAQAASVATARTQCGFLLGRNVYWEAVYTVLRQNVRAARTGEDEHEVRVREYAALGPEQANQVFIARQQCAALRRSKVYWGAVAALIGQSD